MTATLIRNDRAPKRHALVKAISERCHIRASRGRTPYAVWCRLKETWQVWRFYETLEEARLWGERWGPK